MPDKSAQRARVRVTLRQWLADAAAWLNSFPPVARVANTGYAGLAAKYDPNEHRVYVEAIEGALSRPEEFKNIALSGGYGVGKSSILGEIVRTHSSEVVQISLSTLGLGEDGGGEKSSTNRIQKEIVKQLLYRQRPSRLPGSRFRRIGRFTWVRSVVPALLLGALAALVFRVTGWSAALDGWAAQLQQITGLDLHRDIWIGGLAAIAAYVVLVLVHNRIQIKGLTVAKAELALSSGDTTYFDQFLDEIVYYFEVDRRRTIVIFEDIDRFDDPHIFETLRALNTLLNGARQLGGRKIRFVYAIRDSIFEEIGRRSSAVTIPKRSPDAPNDVTSAEATPSPEDERVELEKARSKSRVELEKARSNRTKFFDLVIPVVPFLTKENATAVLRRALEDRGITGISDRLTSLVASDLTDMRLIWNICTEFQIFESRVFPPDAEGGLKLNRDKLFAMIVYKSTHLGDFEGIRSGTSQLNELYDRATAIMDFGLRDRAAQASAVMQRLQNLDGADERADDLGKRLEAYGARLARHLGQRSNAVGPVSLNGVDQTSEQVHSAEFWRSFATDVDQIHLTIGGTRLAITRKDAAAALDTPISTDAWGRAARAELEGALESLQAERATLGEAGFAELTLHPEYVDAAGKSFLDALEDLASSLARNLVRAGFIDRYFTLYTAPFYDGNLTANAMNFLMQSVDRHLPAPNYKLSAAEVDAVVEARGAEILADRSMLNTSVLDRVLSVGGQGATDLVAALRFASSDDRVAVLDSYLVDGLRREELLSRLAPGWAGVLEFLTSTDRPLDPASRSSFVATAIKAMDGDVSSYEIDEATRLWLREHVAEVEVFTDSGGSSEVASKASSLLLVAGVVAADLAPLRIEVRDALVSVGSYDLTLDNLRAALGGDPDLALTEIYKASPAVYSRVLADLPGYVDLMSDGDGLTTLHGSPDLPKVIGDVAASDATQVGRLLDRADVSVEMPDLTQVPAEVWPELARRNLFPTTFANVSAYMEAHGGVDQTLGGFLSVGDPIETPEAVPIADRVSLVTALLAASESVPDAETRARLAKSVLGEAWLPPASTPPGDAELFGLLVKHQVIEDSQATFQAAVERDWPTREAFIENSDRFIGFVSPELLPLVDVEPLLTSARVPSEVKDYLVANAALYVTTPDPDTLGQVLEYSATHHVACSPAVLIQAANAGLAPAKVLASLVVAAADLDLATLSQVVGLLGDNYSELLVKDGRKKTAPDTADDRALLDRLQALEVVSSYNSEGDGLAVWMKRPT